MQSRTVDESVRKELKTVAVWDRQQPTPTFGNVEASRLGTPRPEETKGTEDSRRAGPPAAHTNLRKCEGLAPWDAAPGGDMGDLDEGN